MFRLRLLASTTAIWVHESVACYYYSSHFTHIGLPSGMLSWRFGSAISQLGQRRVFVLRPSLTPEQLPPETPVDEERVPGYKLEHYYPANPGGMLLNRYRLEVKVGWGSSPTVWLAREVRKYFTCSLSLHSQAYVPLAADVLHLRGMLLSKS